MIKIKHWMLTIIFLFSIYPIMSMADITVDNHTHIYATGYTKRTCSSAAGSSGVLQPYQSNFNIPQSILDTFCFISNCTVHVYASQDCSGDKIAIVEVDRKKGITSLINLDLFHYNMIWNANHVTINANSV